MRKLVLPAAALAAATMPAPLLAQEIDPVDTIETAPLADMAEQMGDPDRQREMALMLRTLTEVVLDMPIAPLAQAAADIAGEEAERIDPDMTLRQMAPEAGDVGEEIERNVPHAMQAMSGMAEGFAAMAPVLGEMMARMRDAFPARDY